MSYQHLDSPYRETSRSRRSPARPSRSRQDAPALSSRSAAAEPSARPARRRRHRGTAHASGAPAPVVRLTSLPTGRGAYVETRHWLLACHGPVCAYCGDRFPAEEMTLDHVTPRRGQTAYDRRDNLVLSCRPCNAAKRDLPLLAFLLARRSRAAILLRYGGHLSPMLVDLARSLAPETAVERSVLALVPWADDDGPSPYRD